MTSNNNQVADNQDMSDNIFECPICKDLNINYLFSCGHSFCYACILPLIRNKTLYDINCPCCRSCCTNKPIKIYANSSLIPDMNATEINDEFNRIWNENTNVSDNLIADQVEFYQRNSRTYNAQPIINTRLPLTIDELEVASRFEADIQLSLPVNVTAVVNNINIDFGTNIVSNNNWTFIPFKISPFKIKERVTIFERVQCTPNVRLICILNINSKLQSLIQKIEQIIHYKYPNKQLHTDIASRNINGVNKNSIAVHFTSNNNDNLNNETDFVIRGVWIRGNKIGIRVHV